MSLAAIVIHPFVLGIWPLLHASLPGYSLDVARESLVACVAAGFWASLAILLLMQRVLRNSDIAARIRVERALVEVKQEKENTDKALSDANYYLTCLNTISKSKNSHISFAKDRDRRFTYANPGLSLNSTAKAEQYGLTHQDGSKITAAAPIRLEEYWEDGPLFSY